MKRTLRLGARVALTTAVLVGVALASAQSGTTQPATPPAAGSKAPSMAQLQREALRLTLIARLPAADRQQATRLLDRADALRRRALELRRQELQAYIGALKSGSAPAVARAQAQQKVASERTTLARDEATLRSDAQSFLQKVPQARALMRYLGTGERAGRGPGGLPGQRGLGAFGPTSPNGRFMEPGSGRASPGPYGPGRAMRGWGDMPYGPMGPGMGPGRLNRQGMNGNGLNRYGMDRGWMDRGWMDRGWMDRDGGMGMPWSSPWMPRRNAPGTPPSAAPQNTTPQNGTPQNGTPQNTTPENTAPQNTTPPSGSGSGGA